MILSEEDAKQTECPFMVDAVTGEAIKCLGTGCMAWRWTEEKKTDAYLQDCADFARENKVSVSNAFQRVWAEKRGTYKNTEGYCGRVGRPANEVGT